MTANRPRAWDSTLPARSAGLARTPFTVPAGGDGNPPWSSLTRRRELRRGARLALAGGGAAPVLAPRRWSPRVPASTIPPDVLCLVDDRDGHFCVRCGRYREVIEHHHRRIKGHGGDTRDHTECPCCIVSLCPWWDEPACHSWAHRNRAEAGAVGLVIPRSAEFPFLFPVLVHSQYDSSDDRAWPTCDGRWTYDEPEGRAA